MNGPLDNTIKRLHEKAYRDAYVEAHVKVGIPYQIRALREQEGRRWSQAELGRRAKKPSNVISRLEDPEYGRHTIRTLLELASAFDVALVVKFVSFGRFLKEFEDVSPESLGASSFTSDLELSRIAETATADVLTNVVNASPQDIDLWKASTEFFTRHQPQMNIAVKNVVSGLPEGGAILSPASYESHLIAGEAHA